MMADSDLSFLEEDEKSDESFRRQLRKEQRELINELHKNRENITIPETLLSQVQALDSKFVNVVSTNEAAIDARGFRLISSIGREQVESLHGDMLQFDTNKFAEKLITFMGGRRGGEQLDWTKLGDRVSGVFSKAPAVNFLHGALDLDPLKARKQRQAHRKPKASVEATKPKEVQDLTDEEESTTKDVSYIYGFLKKECEVKGRLHYFKFLVDPDSFAHTVENMFHCAFLIKDGRAGVMMGQDGQPYLYLPSSRNEAQQSTKSEKNQFIGSFRISDWERAKEKFRIVTAAVPPRPVKPSQQ